MVFSSEYPTSDVCRTNSYVLYCNLGYDWQEYDLFYVSPTKKRRYSRGLNLGQIVWNDYYNEYSTEAKVAGRRLSESRVSIASCDPVRHICLRQIVVRSLAVYTGVQVFTTV